VRPARPQSKNDNPQISPRAPRSNPITSPHSNTSPITDSYWAKAEPDSTCATPTDYSTYASAEGKCSATYSSASCPRDFFSRRACSRRTASFDGSIVVVMRTRFGRPDFGRPADRWRFPPPTASSPSGHTRKPSGAIVKDVGERDAVFYENIPRFLSDHRLHVNPRLRADRRPADARCRLLIRSCSARITLDRR
jgi:hypothetical protein